MLKLKIKKVTLEKLFCISLQWAMIPTITFCNKANQRPVTTVVRFKPL